MNEKYINSCRTFILTNGNYAYFNFEICHFQQSNKKNARNRRANCVRTLATKALLGFFVNGNAITLSMDFVRLI